MQAHFILKYIPKLLHIILNVLFDLNKPFKKDRYSDILSENIHKYLMLNFVFFFRPKLWFWYTIPMNLVIIEMYIDEMS